MLGKLQHIGDHPGVHLDESSLPGTRGHRLQALSLDAPSNLTRSSHGVIPLQICVYNLVVINCHLKSEHPD
jgi:hypothetical protein